MDWISLTSEDQLAEIIGQSKLRPQLIFKHSNRCGVSSMVRNRLEKASQPQGIDFYFLDLITYRTLSNRIAELFQVHHESPQILMIKEGECVYDESHMAITMDEIEASGLS